LASFHLDVLHSNSDASNQRFKDNESAHTKVEKRAWSPLHSRTIRSIFVCPEKRAVLITIPNAVILLSVPLGALLPQHLATLHSDDFIHNSVLVRSAQDWKIWTAHDDARIVMHHLAGSTNRLLYSASATHKNVQEAKRVKFLVPSRCQYGNAFSVLESGMSRILPRIFELFNHNTKTEIKRTSNKYSKFRWQSFYVAKRRGLEDSGLL
jgi:hypothetical protein